MVGLRERIDHLGDRRLDDANARVGGDFRLDIQVLDLGDAADDAAGGDDLVTLLHRLDRRLQLLHAALLGANHQEIEDDEDQEQRREAEEARNAARAGGAARGLGVSRGNEHRTRHGWSAGERPRA